jgi:hypothetical protein
MSNVKGAVMKYYLYYLLLVLLMSACAGNKANVDFDPAVDFSTYKTFAWSNSTDEATTKSKTATPLVHQRVRESIEATLNTRGFQTVDVAKADMLVTYHLSVAVTGHTSSSVSVGIGRSSFGSSGRASIGVSGSVPIGGRTVQEGTMVIALIDAKTNSVIWQGSSSRQLSRSPTPEKQQAMINEVVNEILANFPPKKK